MVNTPQGDSLGFIAIAGGLLNNIFNILNPALTAIFYILSITWLCVQIYHKVKKRQ